MAATKTVLKNDAITLKGSVEIVAEYFNLAVNSILFQRGLYSVETFKKENYHGLPVLVTDDKDLSTYLENIFGRVKEWLTTKTIRKLVLVVKSVESQEDLERWQFDIECDKTSVGEEKGKAAEKSVKEIRKEIQGVIRQITASVTFLPIFEEACSFDILVYTDKDQEVPEQWEESGPHYIPDSKEVRFSSVNTDFHKVDSLVAYKVTY